MALPLIVTTVPVVLRLLSLSAAKSASEKVTTEGTSCFDVVAYVMQRSTDPFKYLRILFSACQCKSVGWDMKRASMLTL